MSHQWEALPPSPDDYREAHRCSKCGATRFKYQSGSHNWTNYSLMNGVVMNGHLAPLCLTTHAQRQELARRATANSS